MEWILISLVMAALILGLSIYGILWLLSLALDKSEYYMSDDDFP